jgi:hypothetical protein
MLFSLYKKLISMKKTKSLPRNNVGFPKGIKYPKHEFTNINEDIIPVTSKGKIGTVILITSYSCDACKRIYPILNTLRNDYHELKFINLILGNKEQVNSLIKKYELSDTNNFSIFDHDKLSEFGAVTFPFAYLLTDGGLVVEKGLVNFRQDFDFLISHLGNSNSSHKVVS